MSKDPKQITFIHESTQTDNGPVVCLGMTFENDEARREYFRNELRKKLPDLKQIEGFPIGEDEDIITLSDPPYYTLCPNPWMNDLIEEWESNRGAKKEVNQALAIDVSEGKNDPIYVAHTYHTKVPYRAIMRYMLYYTNPGDIVYDGFAGTGMTGVAAEKCQDSELVRKLMGDDYSEEIVGKRNAVLIDLAPAATFIAQNHSKKTKLPETHDILRKVINELKTEYNWSVSTLGSTLAKVPGKSLNDTYTMYTSYFGEINYVIWSELYQCSSCNQELNYWDATVEEQDGKDVNKELVCYHCGAKLIKRDLEKIFISHFDYVANKIVRVPKVVPVRINYSYKGKRFNKKPDWYDLEVFKWFENYSGYSKITKMKFIEGVETSRPVRNGLFYFHQVYTYKNLSLLDKFLELSDGTGKENEAQFLLGSAISRLSKFNRYMPQHNRHVGPMANALYLPSLSVEINPISQLELQLNKLLNAWSENQYSGNVLSTQSSTSLPIKDNSIDYIFIDPPFGANIMYSELNFIREAWLKVFTNNKKEAIENKAQGKTLGDYTDLMLESFREAYRILKPNSWITVEFSNTSASVWNAIQYVIQNAGFVIASVDALDKKRGGFHGIITTTGVKQDLVISAYKPADESIIQMKSERNTVASAWTFINQHLKKLPVFTGVKGNASIILERTPRILYDRMIAYHVQTGLPIPINALDFQKELAQRYSMRDGMVFLESQVAEYDRKRILAKDFVQQTLFVSDETSAIEWIRQQLLKKPQTRQDIQPNFMIEIQHIAKHELLPELDDLLHQNFLRYDGDGNVPDQIVSYLRRNYKDLRGLEPDDPAVIDKAINRWYVPDPNKQADLEKLREKALLREFDGYIEELEKSKKKLKQFRTEAIRAGFKKAYGEKDFEKIVKVGDRLPESIIQEDDKLLMYYDNASIRLGL
ncbi:DNA methyltransferase [Niallia sp. XMNu-256]|uniref:DNA methyltransferase n=1 Tax=Niallia sp. XMNu-256 TaxID=3082444 RepID=UPI0030D59EB6